MNFWPIHHTFGTPCGSFAAVAYNPQLPAFSALKPLQNLAEALVRAHTEPMNLRRQGAQSFAFGAMPKLRLGAWLWLALALLVMMMAFGAEAFAQQNAQQIAQNFGFPYMDPDPNRAKMLANAFVAQMGLFLGGVGGNSVPALTMLGGIAALIGGMSILFFRQFQPSIIAGWLLLVSIVIFVPLNSRLLFSPIKVAEARNVTTVAGGAETSSNSAPQNGAAAPVQHNGNSCVSNPRGCGFTPQLAAVHVTSIVQIILSDLFRSTGWRGLMERQAADSMLRTRPELKLSEAWLKQNMRYVEQCSGQNTLGELIAGINPQNNSNSTSTEQIQPHRFGELWERWGADFAQNKEHNAKPFIALLPSTLAQAKQYGWGNPPNSIYSDYERALTAIYNDQMAGSKTVRFEPAGTGQISVAEALVSLGATNFFAVSANTATGQRAATNISVNPGFFMMPIDFANTASTQQAQARACYFIDTPPENKDSWREYLGSYVKGGVSTASGGLSSQNSTRSACLGAASGVFSPGAGMPVLSQLGVFANLLSGVNASVQVLFNQNNVGVAEAFNQRLIWGTPQNQWDTYNFINERLTGRDKVDLTLTAPWNAFLRNYPQLSNMPVVFGDPDGLPDSAGVPYGGGFIVKPFKPIPKSGCKEIGQALLAQAIKPLERTTNGGTQLNNHLETYLGMLKGTETIDDEITINKLLKNSDTNGGALRNNNFSRFTFINMLADDANNTLLTSGARGQSQEAKRAALINRYIRLAQDVTAQNFRNINTQGIAGAAATDGRIMNMRLVGNQTLTETAGGYFFWLGEKIIQVYSLFIGPIAMATIMFLNVFIDLAVFGVIVITPFLLIAGMLQPRKAFGYLIISVMVVFVLKFVPISLIILNNVAGMVFELLPTAIGMNAGLVQALMIVGMATLYTGLVGFTLYILFKSGDPASTLGALANFDSAAKQAAQTSMKYGIAAAATALALAGGALGAAIGSQFLKNNMKNQLAKIPGAGALMSLKSEYDAKRDDDEKTREAAAAKQAQAAVMDRNNRYGEFVDDGKTIEKGPQNAGPTGSFSEAQIEAMERIGGMSDEERTEVLNYLNNSGPDGAAYLGTASDGRSILAKLDSNGQLVASLDPPQQDPAPMAPKATEGAAPQVNNEDDPKLEMAENDAANKKLEEILEAAKAGGGDGTITAARLVASDGKEGKLGGPVPVDVVKGKLESVEKLPEMRLAEIAKPTENLTPEQRLKTVREELQNEKSAEQMRLLKENQARIDAEESPEAKAALIAQQQSINNGDFKAAAEHEQAAVQAKMSESERKMGVIPKTLAELELKRDGNIEKFENQIQEWRSTLQSRLTELEAVEKPTYAQQKAIAGIKDGLKHLDTADGIAYHQGDHLAELSKYGDATRAAMLKADIEFMPTRTQSALSAVYGWGSGLFAGGGSIPFIGNVLKEVGNEYLQAPERAKAWKAAGGFGKWWSANTKAQQMGYYSKEVAPLAAAAQYEAMGSLGMFEGNIRLAQQAATEAVARSRSDFEALRYRLDQMDKDPTNTIQLTDKRQYMTAADLYGSGMENSIQRVNTVYQDALQGRDSMMEVVRAKYDDNGNYVGERKENVRRTIEMMSDINQRMIGKSYGGAMEATMLKYYGLFEKSQRAGVYENVRDSEKSLAQLEVARLDAESNYLVGGHINMVQGKADFFGYRGRYQAYNQLRNQTNTMLHDYIQQNAAALNVPMNITPQINQTAYAAAVKAATKEIGPMNLPLNAVFEEAQSTGFANIIVKSKVARFNVAAQEDDNYEKVEKAAASALEAKASNLQKNLKSKFDFEFKNQKYNVGKTTNRLYEKSAIALGEFGEQGFEVLTNILENQSADYLKKNLSASRSSITKDGRKGERVVQDMSKELFDKWTTELAKVNQSAAAKLSASVKNDSRAFRRLADGSIRFGLLEILERKDKNGVDEEAY